MNKLLIICGPTATGKTSLGISLAKKFNGEIVSTDSRQVYKGMDVLTGKDLPADSRLKTQNSKLNIKNEELDVGYRLKEDIPIWLVDIVEPDYPFNAGQYSLLSRKVITNIWKRDKLPVVVGGAGLYIRSIIDPMGNIVIPPNNRLRNELAEKTVEELQHRLAQVDRDKWEKMNSSDKKNPRRLIRAIEIALWKERNPDKSSTLDSFKYDSLLMVGLRIPVLKDLYPAIDKRVNQRLQEGAIKEVKALIDRRYSWNLPALTSTGARELKEYIEGRDSLNNISTRWKIRENNYAVTQMTWFKKEKRIEWFDITEKDYKIKIEKGVRKWYTLN